MTTDAAMFSLLSASFVICTLSTSTCRFSTINQRMLLWKHKFTQTQVVFPSWFSISISHFLLWHWRNVLFMLSTAYFSKVNTLDAPRNRFSNSEQKLTSVAGAKETLTRGRIIRPTATDGVLANETQDWMDTIMHTCRFEIACQITFYLIFSDVLEAEK